MRAVEELDEFVKAEDLLVAVGPAEADKVVHQSLGQETVLLVLDDGPGAVALGELGSVRSENHGHVTEGGNRKAESLIDENLAGGIGHVVVTADDVGDAHVVVIYNHGHVVCGGAVRAADDHVVKFPHIDTDAAFDHVIEDNLAFQGTLEAYAAALAGAEIEIAAMAVIAGLEAAGLGALAHGVDLFLCASAPVGVAGLKKLVHVLVVEVHAFGLVGQLAVPGEAEPFHGGQNGIRVFLFGAQKVSILDAETELPLEMAGEEPGENGGAGAADMQVPRRAGGEAGYDRHSETLFCVKV